MIWSISPRLATEWTATIGVVIVPPAKRRRKVSLHPTVKPVVDMRHRYPAWHGYFDQPVPGVVNAVPFVAQGCRLRHLGHVSGEIVIRRGPRGAGGEHTAGRRLAPPLRTPRGATLAIRCCENKFTRSTSLRESLKTARSATSLTPPRHSSSSRLQPPHRTSLPPRLLPSPQLLKIEFLTGTTLGVMDAGSLPHSPALH